MEGKAISSAVQLHRQGLLDQAETAYLRILDAEPADRDAAYYLAGLWHQRGRHGEAVRLFRELLGRYPEDAAAWMQLGAVLKQQGDVGDAAVSFARAVELQPEDAAAHYNLGVALVDCHKAAEALACFDKAILLRPLHAKSHVNRGGALLALNRWEEARASCEQALGLATGIAEAHANLGLALNELGRVHDAASSFHRALSLNPKYVPALCGLGAALQAQGRYEEADACLQHGLEVLGGGSATAPGGTVAAEERAGLLRAGMLNSLGTSLLEQGFYEEALANFRKAIDARPEYLVARANVLFCMNFCAHDPSDYLSEARQYGTFATRAAPRPYLAWPQAEACETLRVGFVSGDFRQHPVGFFIEGLLANLDPRRVQAFAYSASVTEDDLTSRIRQRFATWRSIVNLDDESAATLIHDDGVQILVDLSGHTARTRLPVFAWRPAPLQVAWLGYFASTGLSQMDYVLADRWSVPEEAQSQFTERIWYMPRSRLCFTPPPFDFPAGPLPALGAGRSVTFCCFNNLSKINDAVVALFSRVVAGVPGARLYLKAKQLQSERVKERTRGRFAAHGIGPERLLLEGPSPRGDYLVAYQDADIALDPFPYTGGATSAESLWMGVPVLTLLGDRMIGRQGASLLANAGLLDWIALDADDYVSKALHFAGNLAELARFRQALRARVLASPVFDGLAFARDFEETLWAMWAARGGFSSQPPPGSEALSDP